MLYMNFTVRDTFIIEYNTTQFNTMQYSTYTDKELVHCAGKYIKELQKIINNLF